MPRIKPQLHMDAHVLQRAVLTQTDLDHINELAKQGANSIAYIVAMNEAHTAQAACASSYPPTSNTGGNDDYVQIITDNGKPKQILKRKHYAGGIAIIDWVNLTVHDTTFEIQVLAISDKDVLIGVSLSCVSIFGFGITKNRGRGANFYFNSYELGDNFGMICYGGQRNTVMISINGTGCAAARTGWERRLFDFINSAQNPKITRIDVAHDDYEGTQFTAESVDAAYDAGLFMCGGNQPNVEHLGNWRNPKGKGRTIRVGSRSNGKFYRGYEKGCELGDKNSKWFRNEIEFKSVDRFIPHEILLFPQDYLCGAYPIFNNLAQTCTRIETIQKTTEISYERTKKWLKHQCGSSLNLINQVEGIDAIQSLFVDGKIPAGVLPPSYLQSQPAIHEYENTYTNQFSNPTE